MLTLLRRTQHRPVSSRPHAEPASTRNAHAILASQSPGSSQASDHPLSKRKREPLPSFLNSLADDSTYITERTMQRYAIPLHMSLHNVHSLRLEAWGTGAKTGLGPDNRRHGWKEAWGVCAYQEALYIQAVEEQVREEATQALRHEAGASNRKTRSEKHRLENMDTTRC